MKRFLNILLRIILVLLILLVLSVAFAAGYFYYTRWSKDRDEVVTYSGDQRIITSKKVELEPTVTCLFLGKNQNLTDFIMLGKYDPNTREVNLMSIPRDTYVKETWDHKINSAYAMHMKVEDTVKIVENLTGVTIDHYILFDTKVLRELVDAIGGVTIDVPFNMNYDDPYQKPPLHIHLKKGTQLLDGDKAEQFVRYRKGYPEGDIGRIKAQQNFIRAMIARCLEPQNLVKASSLVNIALDNTKTDVTFDIASKYIDDAVAFKKDRVRIETMPNTPKYINNISYVVVNEEETAKLIDELFNHVIDIETLRKMIEEEEESGNLITVRTDFSGDKIRIEVLNNGASSYSFNKVVEKLNNAGYEVHRVGIIEDKDNDFSKITTYVSSPRALEVLNEISELIGISKLETGLSENDDIDFTIVLGPKYVS